MRVGRRMKRCHAEYPSAGTPESHVSGSNIEASTRFSGGSSKRWDTGIPGEGHEEANYGKAYIS